MLRIRREFMNTGKISLLGWYNCKDKKRAYQESFIPVEIMRFRRYKIYYLLDKERKRIYSDICEDELKMMW